MWSFNLVPTNKQYSRIFHQSGWKLILRTIPTLPRHYINQWGLRLRIGSAVPDNAERDSRSIFIGNVDFSCSVEEVQVLISSAICVDWLLVFTSRIHFRSFSETVERSMRSPFLLTNTLAVLRGLRILSLRTRFGLDHIFAFLYIVTLSISQASILAALEKNNSLLRDRPIKVVNKRTNLPIWQVCFVSCFV